MRMVFFEPCRAEDGDAGANEMKGAKSPDEFFEYFPGKTQFIGTAPAAVQEYGVFSGNDPVWFIHTVYIAGTNITLYVFIAYHQL
jgi:hypothetical protein